MFRFSGGNMDLQKMWAFIYKCVSNDGANNVSIDYWRDLPGPGETSDTDFYSELAWCVYNGGMSERVIRSKWPYLKAAYHEFDPDAVASDPNVLQNALMVINHKGKAKAVIASAGKIINDRPIGERLASLSENEVLSYLETYPFIGSVTKYHLARNCGMDVVKPDVHLVRLTDYLGYESPDALVSEIVGFTGLRKGLIDFVLWRFLSWYGPAAYETISLFR
ncbi:hypothetical protein [Pelotomaculum propionicicum]|uniref:hypothetical protein n=1 Tax=Pelotomaculum propionicicum TaxID=258475 RepID=UPI003BA3C1FF